MNKYRDNFNDNKDDRWWKSMEDTFTEINIRGLKVECPQCKEKGLVITRWIKGPTLKPIYIFHIKQGKIYKVCEPTKNQSKEIRSEVKIYKGDIKKIMKIKESFVLFSGGKDSLSTLLYLEDIAQQIGRDLNAIFVDTTAGLPENTKYVKEVCKYLGVNLKVVRPKTDYFTLAKKWGIPSYGYRWCCRELKIKPIEEYLSQIKEPKVVFDGIRAIESHVRKQYIPIWYHPTFKCLSVSPIFYWEDKQVYSIINNNGIPKTLLHSILETSTECWCGAYKTETDFKKLYNLNKDMYKKLSKIEEESQNRYTFIYKKGQKVPLKELERRIIKEKYDDRNMK